MDSDYERAKAIEFATRFLAESGTRHGGLEEAKFLDMQPKLECLPPHIRSQLPDEVSPIWSVRFKPARAGRSIVVWMDEDITEAWLPLRVL